MSDIDPKQYDAEIKAFEAWRNGTPMTDENAKREKWIWTWIDGAQVAWLARARLVTVPEPPK